DVVYRLKAEDHAVVYALLQSAANMGKLQPIPHNAAMKDYRRAFLPSGIVPDPPRPPTPPPDSPPLTPIFPRSARYKRPGRDTGGLRSFAELPERIGALREKKLLDVEDVSSKRYGVSVDALAQESMLVVDGWQTFAPSSPSITSSVDDEFDELADMFPSSPDTSVVDAMNLVQDVEDSKLDEIQIPRDRRIGGSLGLPGESIVDKAQKAGG
ncbi:hypothetical protein C0991_009946, partial [Blastosporella zonata]